MNKLLLVICAGGVFAAQGLGEPNSHSVMMKETSAKPVTGNLRVDLFGQARLFNVPDLPQREGPMHSHKSPYLAVGLSLVVPGAGQFYTEHYWEAAAFLAADVAAWVLAYNYDKKGDTQTDFFQNYADSHWSVVKYAQYAQDTYVGDGRFQWHTNPDPNLPPWRQVNWGVLNEMERYISSNPDNPAGQYYSHTLPLHGDQQYYELIGKYTQFNPGWEEANYLPGEFNYGDPVVPQFTYYSKERGKANDFYNSASTWVTIAIVNHIVNAVYAGLSAGWYNTAHAEFGVQQVPSESGYASVPVLKLRFAM